MNTKEPGERIKEVLQNEETMKEVIRLATEEQQSVLDTKEQWEKDFRWFLGSEELTEEVKDFIRATREQTKKEERERIYNKLLDDEELQFEILKIDDDTLGVMCERLGLTDNKE
jgi:histone deacetylase complex regulatory component SIN3